MNYLQQLLARGYDPNLLYYEQRPMPTIAQGDPVTAEDVQNSKRYKRESAAPSTLSTVPSMSEVPGGDTYGVIGAMNQGGIPSMSEVPGGDTAGVIGAKGSGNAMNGMDWGKILSIAMKYFGGG